MNKISEQFEDLTPEQQTHLVEYLRREFIPTKAINRKHSAYWLKQQFTRKEPFFVTQEQFTEGMRRAGFTVEPLDKGNAWFNISEGSPYFRHLRDRDV